MSEWTLERRLWQLKTAQDSPELAEAMDFFIEAGSFAALRRALSTLRSSAQAHSQRYVFRDTRYALVSASFALRAKGADTFTRRGPWIATSSFFGACKRTRRSIKKR